MRRRLDLPDGRHLAHLEFGDPAGVPAIYLHGTPSSASEARWLHLPALGHGVRLVSLDRPGYPGTAERPGDPLTGVAEDVLALADALEIGSFAVVGFSGGAAFAFAAAHRAPERVTVVHVGGGIGPLAGDGWRELPRATRIAFRALVTAPVVFRPALAALLRLNLRGLEKRLVDPVAAARWFFAGPTKGDQIAAIEAYVEATPPDELRQDLQDFRAAAGASRAAIRDLQAYARPWPFSYREITTPVELWHGLSDPAAPPVFAERAARDLPNAETHFFPGEGHFVFHAHGHAVVTSIRDHAVEAVRHPRVSLAPGESGVPPMSRSTLNRSI